MIPRVQLGSVPFSMLSMQTLSVSDDSITTAKIVDDAVTSAKLNIDDGLQVTGNITMTGTLDGSNAYWADYRDYMRFLHQDGVTDSDLCPEGGVAVGVVGPTQSLELQTGNDIAANYWPGGGTCVNVHQVLPCGSIITNYYPYSAESCSTDFTGKWAPFYWWNGEPLQDVTYNILQGGIACFELKYACIQPNS